ncbi:pantoate--beta-alanine ligase [Chloroflexota bacterium]
MKIVETVAGMRQVRKQLAGPVGFVPTMGYLHEGHLSLIRLARAESSSLVVSLFVNPAQFGPDEDFKTYPRDIKRDFSLMEKEKTDVVFMPPTEEIYPPDFNSWVNVSRISEKLEGASRPGHFRGVATVCAKLFNIIQPYTVYIGQKDAQQALVLRKMVADLNMNLKLITLPTIREFDGLAVSSRNAYLNPKERQAAVILYRALCLARGLRSQEEKDAKKIRRQMVNLIKQEPLAAIDYVSIADAETLEELDMVPLGALVSMAVRIGRTRLIDNVVLE